ncbi:galactose-specific lectin nattectin-like, partial [Epinephelus fuscoguttatus]|uniref:galactose-specific lectin nattectin-like n=1 Tax=Epinephelus fuscoguttatus TaxID=293821 RepID=UPI0020D0DE81
SVSISLIIFDCVVDVCCDPCKVCPPGWTLFEDHCYVYEHTAKTWGDAEASCIDQGGNLASIPDKRAFEFIKKIIHRATGKHSRAWIGGHDAPQEGKWLWSDGTKFGFTSWNAGQPDNYQQKEHCAEINPASMFNDLPCSFKNPYVCGKHV